MSAKTSRRRDAAIKQRQHLKADGFTDHDIQAFAQIFTTPDPSDEPRFGCAADTSEEDK